MSTNDTDSSWTKRLRDSDFRHTIKRIFCDTYKAFPLQMTLIVICTTIVTLVGVVPEIFLQKILVIVEDSWQAGSWDLAQKPIFNILIGLALWFIAGLICQVINRMCIPKVSHGMLYKLREKMFVKMEALPISYFDNNEFGDIMSHYTNDMDVVRQLISNSLQGLYMGIFGTVGTLILMFYYSFWMTLVVLAGVVVMNLAIAYLGSRSAHFFKVNQKAMGACEGFVEEAMSGQRTIKVFCHEDEICKTFDDKNEDLFQAYKYAMRYANIMTPTLFSLGNILYIIVAFAGALFIYHQVPNMSISGLPLDISVVVPFLGMTQGFTGSFSNISNNMNSVVRGVAGAQRIYTLMDKEAEVDQGHIGLVPVEDENSSEPSWVWEDTKDTSDFKKRQLQGDIVLSHVDFSYTPGQKILKDISLYAKPGQKIAFVGATGAGKTTITNLLNRFYDIDSGEIFYDGIELKKIRKADLRKSLGMVLQDTSLFSASVLDNIRFGNLSATDKMCIDAACLAGADSFIRRLPEGYDTQLVNNGSNLSQGQRQLISIARAAVANPPVMILDEATSSIDTRTEALVQLGMDNLMEGRTTFVIAHRLSTVRNSDLICVLDHGRIIEKGTHSQLLEKQGVYWQLYTGAFELE